MSSPQAQASPTIVEGRDLRVGDVLHVWWHPHTDLITAIRPLADSKTQRIAEFAVNRGGMTIHRDGFYEMARRREARGPADKDRLGKALDAWSTGFGAEQHQ